MMRVPTWAGPIIMPANTACAGVAPKGSTIRGRTCKYPVTSSRPPSESGLLRQVNVRPAASVLTLVGSCLTLFRSSFSCLKFLHSAGPTSFVSAIANDL